MDSENNNIIEDENSAQVNIAQLNPAEESKQNFVSYVWDENIIPYHVITSYSIHYTKLYE